MRWPSLIVLAAILATTGAQASFVSDWQDQLAAADAKGARGPLHYTRCAAMLHLAMFDSGNAVARRFVSYRPPPEVGAAASAYAAAATAAHAVLSRLYPESVALFDERLRLDLETVAEGTARESGVRLGRTMAERLLAERAGDGWSSPSTYRAEAHPPPGRYRTAKTPVGSHLGAARPFAIGRAEEFRPGPPPSLESVEWARARDEVRGRGGKDSSERSPEDTELARFIAVSHTKFSLQPVSAMLARRGLPWLEESRLMALVTVASADATLASFEAKYHYLFWRPDSVYGEGWTPLIDTPPHPEYPCQHCVQAGVVAEFLEASFPDRPPTLRFVNPSAADKTREFASPAAIIDAMIQGRIDGGIHFRFSGVAGARLGRAVTERTLRELLRPRQ